MTSTNAASVPPAPKIPNVSNGNPAINIWTKPTSTIVIVVPRSGCNITRPETAASVHAKYLIGYFFSAIHAKNKASASLINSEG